MKQISKIILIFTFVFSLLPINLYGSEKTIWVFINGEKINFSVNPIIENGTTLVQYRPIFEALGLKIEWDQETQTVTGYKDGLEIQLVIDKKSSLVNGESKELRLAPKIVNGDPLVPIRFVAESSGGEVIWDQKSSTIYVFTDINKLLQYKVSMNDINSVRKLLEQGANPNIKDRNDETPLMIATRSGTEEMVKILLDAGANVNIKDGQNQTALDIAKKRSISSLIKLLEEASIAQLSKIVELKKFLEQNFSELDTSIGKTYFEFEIHENKNMTAAYDYWIKVKYNSDFFDEVQNSDKLSSSEKEKVKRELKEHQQKIAEAVIKAMPGKKFYGGYYDSWYRYPILKFGLTTRHYYSWINFSGEVTDSYDSTKPSTFRWYDLFDDDF
jgi:hypothetical protein